MLGAEELKNKCETGDVHFEVHNESGDIVQCNVHGLVCMVARMLLKSNLCVVPMRHDATLQAAEWRRLVTFPSMYQETGGAILKNSRHPMDGFQTLTVFTYSVENLLDFKNQISLFMRLPRSAAELRAKYRPDSAKLRFARGEETIV